MSNNTTGAKDKRTSGPVNAHLTPGPGIPFNAFIHVYGPRAGADNPLGQMLISAESPYHFAHLLQVLKQYLYVFFFMFFHMYIALDRGRQTPGVKILMSTKKALSF